MSRLFKKSKKSLVILLTIAFVMSIAAVPAFASTSYTSLTVPTVQDDDGQDLGVFSIEVDPLVDGNHKASVEVEDAWDINSITVHRIVYDEEDAITTGSIPSDILLVNDVDFSNGTVGEELVFSELFDEDSYDSLTIELDTDELGAEDSVEVWLSFNVDVDDTGDIRAYFTNLVGQLEDGDVLIGRARAGELEVVVRDYTSFVDSGPVEIRVTEDLRNTWEADDENGDELRLRLPRYFNWADVEDDNDLTDVDGNIVFGDVNLQDFKFRLANNDRDLFIEYDGDMDRAERVRFDFTVTVQVDDEDRASKGDIIATTGGDYDVTPDEIIVGVFGDYDINVFAGDPETVYAGKSDQDVANITIEEDVATTIIDGRTITLTLPEWAAWLELDEDESFDHRGVELTFRDVRRGGTQMRFDVSQTADEFSDPASVEIEDLEIMLDTKAAGDVVVDIGGTAGVFGEVIVAEAVSPVIMEVPEPTYTERDASGQPLGDIYLTEAYAGAFADHSNDDEDYPENNYLVLDLGQYMEWESGYEVVVEDGDIDLGSPSRAGRYLNIPVTHESDEVSTIRVSGTMTAYMSAIRGANNVNLTAASGAVVDADVRYGDQDDLHSFGAQISPAATAVVTYIDEEPVLDVTEVVMWIGLTTYTVNGEAKEMDVAPFIENDRTFVPVSFIAAEFGLEADWGPVEGLTEWVTFECEDMDILVEIEIGSPYITVTEEGVSRTVTSDVAAQIVGDRTYLPLRAVGEIFGATFDWGPKETLTEWVSFTMMN